MALDDPPAALGITQGGHALFERQAGDFGVRPRRCEHAGRRFEAEQYADGPRGHLGLDIKAFRLEPLGQGHEVAPALRGFDVLLHRVADRAAAQPGELGHQGELGVGERIVRCAITVREELEHALPALPQHRGQRHQLGLPGA